MVSVFAKACGAALCAGVMMLMSSCFGESYTVKLSGPVTIGDQWVTLSPAEPMKADKTYQWVLLSLEPPLKYDGAAEGSGPERGKGILMPNGQTINPEIEVVDQSGNTFKFIYRGAKGGPIYGYSDPATLPRDREYKTVRIRSRQPIRCKAVYWYNESSNDWK